MKERDYITFECNHIYEANEHNIHEQYALAYADVDGYTQNEEEEGAVICRVWLLKQFKGYDRESTPFLVDWHDNRYRLNEPIQEVIKQAEENLIKYVDSLVDIVFHKAYERYKLKWMLGHGHTLDELMKELDKQMDKPGVSRAESPSMALDQFKRDGGFSGELWPCEAEFRDYKAQDEQLMSELLSGNEREIWENRSKDWQ